MYYLKKYMTFSCDEEFKVAGDRLEEYLALFYGIKAEKTGKDVDIIIKKGSWKKNIFH